MIAVLRKLGNISMKKALRTRWSPILPVRYRDPLLKSSISVSIQNGDGETKYVGVLWARKINYVNMLIKLPKNIKHGDTIILNWTDAFKISALACVKIGRVELEDISIVSMRLNGETISLDKDEYAVLRLGDHLRLRFNTSEKGVYIVC